MYIFLIHKNNEEKLESKALFNSSSSLLIDTVVGRMTINDRLNNFMPQNHEPPLTFHKIFTSAQFPIWSYFFVASHWSAKLSWCFQDSFFESKCYWILWMLNSFHYNKWIYLIKFYRYLNASDLELFYSINMSNRCVILSQFFCMQIWKSLSLWKFWSAVLNAINTRKFLSIYVK